MARLITDTSTCSLVERLPDGVSTTCTLPRWPILTASSGTRGGACGAGPYLSTSTLYTHARPAPERPCFARVPAMHSTQRLRDVPRAARWQHTRPALPPSAQPPWRVCVPTHHRTTRPQHLLHSAPPLHPTHCRTMSRCDGVGPTGEASTLIHYSRGSGRAH